MATRDWAELRRRREANRQARAQAEQNAEALRLLNTVFSFRPERMEVLRSSQSAGETFHRFSRDVVEEIPSGSLDLAPAVTAWLIQKLQERTSGDSFEISIGLPTTGFTDWILVHGSEVGALAASLWQYSSRYMLNLLLRFKSGHVVGIADAETRLELFEARID